MVTFSTRFLAVLIAAVVAVSLVGSFLGYALGSSGKRSDAIAALVTSAPQDQPHRTAPSPAGAGASEPSLPAAEGASGRLPTDGVRAVQPSAPQRMPDSRQTTGLAVGATAAKGGVAVALTEAQPSVWEPGMEFRLMMTNTSGGPLHFFFSPDRDLTIADNRGVRWDLRWAEYDGEVTLPDGETRLLVRALYHGELGNPNVDHLTLTLRDAPGLGAASWTVPVPRQSDGTRP